MYLLSFISVYDEENYVSQLENRTHCVDRQDQYVIARYKRRPIPHADPAVQEGVNIWQSRELFCRTVSDDPLERGSEESNKKQENLRMKMTNETVILNVVLKSEIYMGDTKRPKAKIFPAIRK